MRPRTLLLSSKAWLWLAQGWSQREQHTHRGGCRSTAPRPLARMEALKHLPLPTLPARPVRVEHAGRASLSQTPILASARYLVASMHHPEKRLTCASARRLSQPATERRYKGCYAIYRHFYQTGWKDR